jgi:hypothetical protein
MKLKKATCPAVKEYVSQQPVSINPNQLTIGEDDVCYRKKCFVKWHWTRPKVVLILARYCDTHVDHSDHNGGEDTDECYRAY